MQVCDPVLHVRLRREVLRCAQDVQGEHTPSLDILGAAKDLSWIPSKNYSITDTAVPSGAQS
jgi:hypothetical protein